ncbi:T9SS type A sorting domain-containing protein, partial [Flavisolibacter sp. BT320]|nr:T9SS type A sorting domain-containing protein [Flavisolibacter longurius]
AFSGSLTRESGNTVGSYAIQQGGVVLNNNYELGYNGANLTINTRRVVITADAKSKTYGEADPALTYQITEGSLVSGDAFSGSLTRESGNTVGSYAIQQGGVVLNNNYELGYNGANLTINKAILTVTANNKEKYCGQANPSFDASISGFVLGQTLSTSGVTGSATFSTTATSSSAAGNYPITVTTGTLASTNYSFVFVAGNLKINGITNIDASASSTPVPLGSTATLSAKISPAVSNVPVTFKIDGVNKGTSLTNNLGVATLQVSGLAVDVYKITAEAGSGCSNSDQSPAYLPVYDPNGGFVTGGGWIMSPAGAYTANMSLTGKANFGFNSKYKKGSSIPEGNTEFQFQAGGLNFQSTIYNDGSLVVATSKAIYKGKGTINGQSGYSFMVSAVDGQINGGGGIDKFRIKIWNTASGAIVYDNGLGADENSIPPTALGGGSIVIHEVKGGKTQKTEETQMVVSPQLTLANKLTLKAYPNPAVSHFNISLESNNTRDAITLKVYNQLGQVVDVKRNLFSGQVVQVGGAYKQGTYFLEVTQGEQKQNLQVVKSN